MSLQSQRPTPPESPHSTNPYIKMTSQLPNTPQSPPLASAANLLDVPSTSYSTSSADSNAAAMIDNMQGVIGDGLDANKTETSLKRKRETDDDGNQEQKKVHIESGTPGIEALHRDVGPPYRLASTPYPKAPIDLTVDLYKVYSLEDVANSVSRAGENPVKLGKTYKKLMRNMGLSGKFDAVKKRDNEAGLWDMVEVPDEQWNQQMQGEKLMDGLDKDLRSTMVKAMTFAKGRIPKGAFDPSVLALQDAVAPVAATKPGINSQRAPVQGTTLNGNQPRARNVIRNQTPEVSAEKARPQRTNKKRSYRDDGFEGYGEGYADDVADDPPFRPGDEDSQQRRKKGSSGYHFQPAMRQAYGPGTVGA